MKLRRHPGWSNLAGRSDEDRALPAAEVKPAFPTLSTSAPLNVTTSNVLRCSDAWACIRCLADSISSLPLHAYRRTTAGRVAAGEESRIVRLLQRPSPGSTGVDLISQIVVHLNVYGECFIGKYRSDQEIVQLGLIPPESIGVELLGQRIVYTLDTVRGRTEHGPGDILHIKAMSMDGLRGLSPVTQCAVALGLSSGLQQSAKTFTEHGSRPSGVLVVQEGNPEQFERLADAWQDRHGGALNQHRIAVLSGEIEWKPVGFSQSDAEFLGQRELSAREVARIFRLPAWAIDAPTGDSLTYSNVLEQNRSLVTHSLRPWLVRIERAISGDPDLSSGNTYVEFNLDGLLRADAKTRAETYTLALNAETGWMRRDEVRELENLPPEEGS